MLDWFSASVAESTRDGLLLRSAGVRYLAWTLLFAGVAVPALLCWRRRIAPPLGPVAGIAALTIPLLVLPGLAMDRVEISPTTMVVTTGIWFRPSRHTLAVEGLLGVTAEKRIVRVRRGTREIKMWVFHYSGFTRSLPLSDLLEAHREPVLAFLRARGVEIVAARHE